MDRGAVNDLIDDAWRHYKEHGRESLQDAFKEATADHVVRRYELKIRHGFARAGIELPEGELSAAVLLGVVRERTGLDIDSLDADAVMAAVDRLLAARLSEALGVQVSTVFDREAMMQSLNQAIIEAIRNGRAREFISRKAMSVARRYATLKRLQIDAATWEKIEARKRQKRYRETHRLEWV